MKKILYAMHINWGWIKQRPHFFAEGLDKDFNVNVIFPIIYKSNLKSGENLNIKNNTFFKLPDRIISRSSLFYFLNYLIVNFQLILKMLIFKPDIIWLTHPVFSGVLRWKSKNTKIIYDCMDDHQLFWGKRNGKMVIDERRLIADADIVFFSSETLLRRKIIKSEAEKSFVVNNGCASYFLNLLSSRVESGENSPNRFVIGYFGAIAEWFDWESILLILNNFDNVYFKLAGPCEKKIFESERIEYCGILKHEKLEGFASGCDALIMPFKVNELIEAVDPVKLYEYISFLKPILAPKYSETERFSKFVSLYHNNDELLYLLDEMIGGKGRKFVRSEALYFIENNTWDVRIDFIISKIKYENK